MQLAKIVLDRMRSDEVGPAKLLVYSSDEQPGWHRRRHGSGFAYRGADGTSPDRNELARIKSLAIPPAWSDVWICRDKRGHIQATGRDEKGRKQYRYHAEWTAHRSASKFDTLVGFAEVLPALRAQVDRDLRRRSLCHERVVASVVWLLDNSLIRIGNPAYARMNKSFGLTTLRRRHVDITGHNLRFRFTGKSGKQWRLQISDRRIANILKSLQDLPGQHLFKYEDAGHLCTVSSRDVNDYLADFAGPNFTAKHFRTWAGSVRAFGLLADLDVPETKSARRQAVNAVIDEVATRLGNTRSVCRQAYIHPAIPERWDRGSLVRRGNLADVDWLDTDEVETEKFLRSLGSQR